MTKITKKPPCKFQCPHCENCYPYQSNLKTHIDIIHLRLRPFICQFCKINNAQEQSFSLKHHLERHIKSYHPDPEINSKKSKIKNGNENNNDDDDDDNDNSDISLSMTESLTSFDQNAKKIFTKDINSVAATKFLLDKTHCKKCDKNFSDIESLLAHNNFLHGNIEYDEEQMHKMNQEFIQKIQHSLNDFNINPKREQQLEQERISLLAYSIVSPLSFGNTSEKILQNVNNLPKKSIFKKNWRYNNKKRKIDPKRRLECFSCDYQTNIKANFKRHLFKIHYFLKKDNLLLYEQQQNIQKPKKTCYSCMFCNFKKEKQSAVQQHCRKVHKKQRDAIFEKMKILYFV